MKRVYDRLLDRSAVRLPQREMITDPLLVPFPCLLPLDGCVVWQGGVSKAHKVSAVFSFTVLGFFFFLCLWKYCLFAPEITGGPKRSSFCLQSIGCLRFNIPTWTYSPSIVGEFLVSSQRAWAWELDRGSFSLKTARLKCYHQAFAIFLHF